MGPILGIDASVCQGARGMSFKRFKDLGDAGVGFGIFRATIGTNVDSSVRTNTSRANKAGWVTGTYHFLFPGNGASQAETYAKHCGDGLAILDVEQSGVSWRDVKDFVRRFRELRPRMPIGCYTSEGAWRNLTGNADGEALFDYLWQARWTQLGTNDVTDLPASAPRAGFGGWRKAPLWQYGAFRVRGYPIIDGNAWYGTLDELRALGKAARPPVEERLKYVQAYNGMVTNAEVDTASSLSPAGSGVAWDKGVADARIDIAEAVGGLHTIAS